ncbi:FAD-dependent oxidoreductase [Xinfangfangia sp. CPCC 101601]|uniref:FAD-dependent oxidoreductase n=1 Tax=Pseudogemmobacter lacusdianii TaxID=3069608 RepID=A0ABU0W187_9RHOB|nr:FAD-dependent oxidoreductase [Xinfangfangia sp. CPCC 101601]MDQ2067658.1 FAD-dependent oxidoreductase [Xinfangfangia sp. CPCC 101601]
MTRSPQHDILFTPLKIGPKTAKNRFYQVPHCNGGGYRDPSAVVEMRRTKAEGGWGVIFTEQTEIHPSSEITPFIEQHLWDDRDIPALARMAEAMKSHGALAGIQLAYSGINGPNLYSREVPLAVSGGPILTFTSDPVQARTMDREDIRDLRRWFRNAFRRSHEAGFDLICLYGAHGFGILQHFLSRATNHRTDEYGGNLENRGRFLREVVEDARETTKGELAVSLRMSLNEAGPFGFSNAELRDFIEMHGDLPDIWDLAHGTWENCSGTSRFKPEAAQEELVQGIKALTSKPVVGVGRFTSPDAMVRQIKSGILDFIGAARPSIADPFLPQKVEQGRYDDIRECIGCNICVSGDMTGAISRCTQNTAFMEEWRKGWHPERPRTKGHSQSVLVIGAGPAGLEAALQAGRRGYAVTLAEARQELGGRVARERLLPGLSAWGRVADYRTGQMAPMPNVEIYRDSPMETLDILGMGVEHILLATGSHWRRDAVARLHLHDIPTDPAMPIYSPDDLMAGKLPEGLRVTLYDDDHFYMGSVLAELLVAKGNRVDFVTPAVKVAEWTDNTLEQATIMRRLLDLGVEIHLNKAPETIGKDEVTLGCTWSGRQSILPAEAVVMVTSRRPEDRLYQELRGMDLANAGVKSLKLIGDAAAPGPIAWATYAGRRWAEELDQDPLGDALTFRREIADLLPEHRLTPT